PLSMLGIYISLNKRLLLYRLYITFFILFRLFRFWYVIGIFCLYLPGSPLVRLAFVVPAPEAKAKHAQGYQVDDICDSEGVGNDANAEDNGNRDGAIEHELQGEYAAFDPIGSMFLDSGLSWNVDEIDLKASCEHDDGRDQELNGLVVYAVLLQYVGQER